MALVERLIKRDARLRLERVDRDPEGLERGGHAREMGVQLASCEVILALDDDVIPRPGLVSGHARRHAAEKGLVVLGAMPVVTPAGRRPDITAQIYGASYERASAAIRERRRRGIGRIVGWKPVNPSKRLVEGD